LRLSVTGAAAASPTLIALAAGRTSAPAATTLTLDGRLGKSVSIELLIPNPVAVLVQPIE